MRPDHVFLKFLLKILWSVGGKGDAVDGLPRVGSRDLEPALGRLRAGDIVLLGNNGVVSHVAVYVGEGVIVHAMATEKTMRGFSGSLWDALWRPVRWVRGQLDKTGVLEEHLGAFVDRFERDTWIALRRDDLLEDQVRRGVDRIRGLVGKPYDYAFRDDDDTWYCTEVAVEFLSAALGAEQRPRFATRYVRVPGLLSTHVIEPIALLDAEDLRPVLANPGARARYAAHLGEVEIV